MFNLPLIVLHHVPPLCDYKVWIDTERGEEVKHHLHNMVKLNMMGEEFHAHRMEERRRTAYFAMQHEMDREEYKKKQEEERAQRREKARREKEVYARGGEKALLKGMQPHLTHY
jgi:hypothetical protein